MQFITGKSDASGFDKIQKIKYPIPFKNKIIGISISTWANGSRPAAADIIYQEITHTFTDITVLNIASATPRQHSTTIFPFSPI